MFFLLSFATLLYESMVIYVRESVTEMEPKSEQKPNKWKNNGRIRV